MRRIVLACAVVVALVVAVDPHPFDGPTDSPSMVMAEAAISPTTATTFPPTKVLPPESLADAPTSTTPAPAPSTTSTAPPSSSSPTLPTSTTLPSTGDPVDAATAAEVPPTSSVVARLLPRVVAFYAQLGDATPAFGLYDTTEFGTPRVLLTTALRGDWIQVLSPLRPNGSTVWVHARDVALETITDRIDVDLATRTLVWSRNGAVLLSAPVAVGASSTPTPTGVAFVTDVLPWDPSDGRGAWIVALDTHSDAYATFEGGDARIAIHGTNDPSSIGAAVSNGCIRLAAGPLDELRAGVPLGTPVFVT